MAYVVTGSASGIGLATRERLEAAGAEVIGVDLRDAEVIGDLATPGGRASTVEEIRASAAILEGVVACAGGASAQMPTDLVVSLNYFGAVELVERLQPALRANGNARIALVASQAMIRQRDQGIIDACLEGDEEKARKAARAPGVTATGERAAYGSAKHAVARWVRRAAPQPEWAGAAIAVNGVAPGIIRSPAVAPLLEDPAIRARMERQVPMPFKGPGEPEDVAALLFWLVSAENTRVTGQVIFCDGGSDCVLRGDDVW